MLSGPNYTDNRRESEGGKGRRRGESLNYMYFYCTLNVFNIPTRNGVSSLTSLSICGLPWSRRQLQFLSQVQWKHYAYFSVAPRATSVLPVLPSKMQSWFKSHNHK
jgi:hypothetical protein